MEGRQSVVLVTVDSWRADRCGFVGNDRDVTPALDALAEDGLVFENAIAPAAATGGSAPTLLAGQYLNPELTGDGSAYAERARFHIRARRTIPRRFAAMGYETGAFTANPWTSRFYGYDRDFDSFEDFMAGDLSSRFIAEGKPRGPIAPIVQLLNWWQGQDMFMSWEAFYDDVLAWLADADRPYFLWLFLVDVHTPYLPPAEHLSRSRAVTYLANLALFFGGTSLPLRSVLHGPLVDAYEDTIRHVDRFVDRLTTDLEALGEEPLVVLTADHGEAFGEEPVFGETDVYGHGNGVAEHQLHVPLVVLNGPSGSVRPPFPVRRLPALLTTLATGGDLESLLEPVAWARTYDPAVLVRGADWRYAWSPTDERVTVRSGDGWTEVDHPELAFVGRRLVDRALEGERERRRIRDATADVAATAAL